MAAWFRNSLYSSMALLWVTGCAWLVLHYFFQVRGEFGTTPHPMQPSLLVVHGVLALAAVFFFGWVAGSHVGELWWRRVNRTSGIALMTLLGVLTVTGVCGYYVTAERVRAGTSLVHQIAGALAIVPALVHWLRGRLSESR